MTTMDRWETVFLDEKVEEGMKIKGEIRNLGKI